MDYIFNFTLYIDDLPVDTFRLTYLDSQNDGTSQDVEFVVRGFSLNSYDISEWGLKKAKVYLRDQLLHDGLLVEGKAYQKDFEGYFYEFTLASPLALFKTRGPDRVFVDKTAEEIINAVFASAGWTTAQWRWRLKQPLPVLAYRVQYHQADYDFMLELLSEFNLNFIFENGVCILSDILEIKTMTHHVESPQPYSKKSYNKFLGYHFKKAFSPDTFFATVEAPDDHQPYLNHEGHYRIRWDFDKTSAPLEGSSPIPLISPHFMHFPLRKDTRVAVRCLDGKMHQPVLIGVIPTVTPEPEKYIHQSYSQHSVCLDRDKLLLMHGHQENHITLSKDGVMSSEKGSVVFDAAKNIIWEIQQDHNRTVGNDLNITVQHDQIISANNMQLSTGRSISFSAQKNLELMASDKIESTSQNTQLFANTVNMITNQNMKITAQKDITVFGQNCCLSGVSIELQSNGSMISMTGGGVVFNTPALMINAGVIEGI